MAKNPILDLNTLIERPKIAIDGTPYEILSPEELSILDSQSFTFWGGEIEQLANEKGKEEELKSLIDTVARKVLVGVPADVFAKLSGAQKNRVIEVFTMLLLRDKIGAVGAVAQVMKGLAPASPLTGERNSPASSASSAETPAGGSHKRRRR
ncbi:hypothetical protein CN221_14780 [Sinorhizobium meliloti]|uniref:hypothetical protein n=1 Tax=Rhizobium meliloti TaxID=382 RepID=UPI000FE13A8F|nr:hypothetical protein [Sinorhizobium meliloti]RVG94839.1 hypothetical protein CN221_14780 [Sinorhizobium meliloti]RVH65466.1 hypothetical protein CN209_12725 [Sinorhizobium meliloti]